MTVFMRRAVSVQAAEELARALMLTASKMWMEQRQAAFDISRVHLEEHPLCALGELGGLLELPLEQLLTEIQASDVLKAVYDLRMSS
jgi:hypothetical protein